MLTNSRPIPASLITERNNLKATHLLCFPFTASNTLQILFPSCPLPHGFLPFGLKYQRRTNVISCDILPSTIKAQFLDKENKTCVTIRKVPFQPCTVKTQQSISFSLFMYKSRRRMPLREAFLFPSFLHAFIHAFLVPPPKAMIDN